MSTTYYRKYGMYYRVCPDCGAILDPGEECECKKKDNYLEELQKCPTTGTNTTDQRKQTGMTAPTIKKASGKSLNATAKR